MKSYTFEVGKQLPPGHREHPGKPEWTALVRIELEPDRALELAQSLIEQVRHARGETVEVSLFGELRESTDEA